MGTQRVGKHNPVCWRQCWGPPRIKMGLAHIGCWARTSQFICHRSSFFFDGMPDMARTTGSVTAHSLQSPCVLHAHACCVQTPQKGCCCCLRSGGSCRGFTIHWVAVVHARASFGGSGLRNVNHLLLCRQGGGEGSLLSAQHWPLSSTRAPSAHCSMHALLGIAIFGLYALPAGELRATACGYYNLCHYAYIARMWSCSLLHRLSVCLSCPCWRTCMHAPDRRLQPDRHQLRGGPGTSSFATLMSLPHTASSDLTAKSP